VGMVDEEELLEIEDRWRVVVA
jgi:hypothetical protein